MKVLALADGHNAATAATFGPVIIDDTAGVYIQLFASSDTISSAVQVQTSADGVNFVNSGSPIAVVASTNVIASDVYDGPAKFIQFVYTNTAGSGTIDLIINLKSTIAAGY